MRSLLLIAALLLQGSLLAEIPQPTASGQLTDALEAIKQKADADLLNQILQPIPRKVPPVYPDYKTRIANGELILKAAKAGDIPTLKEAVLAGGLINTTEEGSDVTALYRIIATRMLSQEDKQSTVEFLLEYGANPDANNRGKSCLYLVALEGLDKIALLLLRAGADPFGLRPEYDPLKAAISRHHLKVKRLLEIARSAKSRNVYKPTEAPSNPATPSNPVPVATPANPLPSVALPTPVHITINTTNIVQQTPQRQPPVQQKSETTVVIQNQEIDQKIVQKMTNIDQTIIIIQGNVSPIPASLLGSWQSRKTGLLWINNNCITWTFATNGVGRMQSDISFIGEHSYADESFKYLYDPANKYLRITVPDFIEFNYAIENIRENSVILRHIKAESLYVPKKGDGIPANDQAMAELLMQIFAKSKSGEVVIWNRVPPPQETSTPQK